MPDDPAHDPNAPASVFHGEEAVEERSTPAKNFVASVAIGAIGIFATVLASRMPNPGDLPSHPGLLPYITGISLTLMALALGAKAVRDGALRAMVPEAADEETRGQRRRTALLIGLLATYIVALDLVSFEWRLPTALMVLHLTSFECVTAPLLALVLRVFWRATWLRCAGVAVVTTFALAATFRHGFKILLPGVE